MEPLRILMVVTSHSELGATGRKTGLWLEGFAAPYYEFADNGAIITVASVEGGEPPLDPGSMGDDLPLASRRFRCDHAAQTVLRHTMEISFARADEYDGVFYPGGHGPMWDLATDRLSASLISEFASQGKPVGAVCHAPAALLPVVVNGVKLIEGRRVTSFSNNEEDILGLTAEMPFLLENMLRDGGAIYSKGSPFEPYAVEDGLVITGQNPASSGLAAALFTRRCASQRLK